jgi:hypothetical protein
VVAEAVQRAAVVAADIVRDLAQVVFPSAFPTARSCAVAAAGNPEDKHLLLVELHNFVVAVGGLMRVVPPIPRRLRRGRRWIRDP